MVIKVNDANSVLGLVQKLQSGRKKIILDYDVVDNTNVLEVLDKALPYHGRNAKDCDFLINYYLGQQNILKRQAMETSRVNNKVVVNRAFSITRQINGYTLGNPVELVQKDVNKAKDVSVITDIYDNVGAYSVDTDVMTYMSICGLGYQITLPSDEISKDNIPDIPITYMALDPRDTFCVYSSTIGNKLLMSCIITHTESNGDVYTVYTDDYVFTISNNKQDIEIIPNSIGENPITMFENSLFLTGDWEPAIGVMDAINTVTSDSLNDIEGTIRSLLVLVNTELEDVNADLDRIKNNRLLSVVGNQGVTADAKFISPSVDSASLEQIRTYLEDQLNIITGIPDRQTASGGDTGTAVLNRNGWTDIEIVAKLKELFFKKAKIKQLSVAIKILKLLNLVAEDTNAKDINITIGRHTTDNLQSKAQAFSTLVGTGELAPIDCLEMSGLTTRINEVIERGEAYKKENQEIENATAEIDNTQDNPTAIANENDGMNTYNQNKKDVNNE